MRTPLHVGVIGTGMIAAMHYAGWQDNPLTRLAALADLNPDALQRAGALAGVDTLYTDPLALIQDDTIDIVDICVPNVAHAPLVIAALQAGKHVLCEKPLALSSNEIDQIIAARDRSGKLLMTAQHFRFFPTTRALHAELARGTLGTIYHARAWILRRAAFVPRPSFIDRRVSGGGAALDIGVHILDLVLWLMDHPSPVSVTGVARSMIARTSPTYSIWDRTTPLPATSDVEEFATGFVRFANGATLSLEVSWILHHKTQGEDAQVWVYGDAAGAHWPSNEIIGTDVDTGAFFERSVVGDTDTKTAYMRECDAFVEAIRSGRPSPVPAEQSRAVARILDGLYQSMITGREVLLEQDATSAPTD